MLRRGHTNPVSGLLYWSFHRGKEVWLTPDVFSHRMDQNRIWCAKNAASVAARSRVYRAKNKTELRRKANERRWKNIENERKKAAEKMRRRRVDPLFRMKCNLSRRMSLFLNEVGISKKSSTPKLIGCSHSEFIEYVRSKFSPGMTFENYGSWHLDHKIPLASAKTEEEVIALFFYKNLQPLWALDNQKKSDKIAA